jgi:hypothetical protein
MCKPWKINGARTTGSECKRTHSDSVQIDSMKDQEIDWEKIKRNRIGMED